MLTQKPHRHNTHQPASRHMAQRSTHKDCSDTVDIGLATCHTATHDTASHGHTITKSRARVRGTYSLPISRVSRCASAHASPCTSYRKSVAAVPGQEHNGAAERLTDSAEQVVVVVKLGGPQRARRARALGLGVEVVVHLRVEGLRALQHDMQMAAEAGERRSKAGKGVGTGLPG